MQRLPCASQLASQLRRQDHSAHILTSPPTATCQRHIHPASNARNPLARQTLPGPGRASVDLPVLPTPSPPRSPGKWHGQRGDNNTALVSVRRRGAAQDPWARRSLVVAAWAGLAAEQCHGYVPRCRGRVRFAHDVSVSGTALPRRHLDVAPPQPGVVPHPRPHAATAATAPTSAGTVCLPGFKGNEIAGDASPVCSQVSQACWLALRAPRRRILTPGKEPGVAQRRHRRHTHTHTRIHTHKYTRTRTHKHARTHTRTDGRTDGRKHTHTHANVASFEYDSKGVM